jgi:peptide/nickel transport system permease protein
MKIKPVNTPSNTYNKQRLKRFAKHKPAMISLIFLCVIILLAILAPAIAPYDPNRTTGGFSKAPDAAHWLGTDQVGRDVLSRLLYGTRISLIVGFWQR